MQKTSKLVLPAIITAMIVTAFALALIMENSSRIAFGSTIQGNDYMSTTTVAGSASSTAPFIIKAAQGTLASVVIVGTSTKAVKFYDHPTSTSTLPAGNPSSGTVVSSSTLLFTIPQASAQGTYTFDISTKTGLLMDVPSGFDGVYVITYR